VEHQGMTQDNSATRDEIAIRSEAKSELVESDSAEARAAAHEARVNRGFNDQFQKLKNQARTSHEYVAGPAGVRTPEKWEKIIEEAGDKIANGGYLLSQLGAERCLDYETTAAILALRQNLIAEQKATTAAAIMAIDVGLIAYANPMRLQRFIGHVCLPAEREFFGQESLNQIHGTQIGERLEAQIRSITDRLIPLQEKCQKMMLRSLASIG
jgi:hypothetical protein